MNVDAHSTRGTSVFQLLCVLTIFNTTFIAPRTAQVYKGEENTRVKVRLTFNISTAPPEIRPSASCTDIIYLCQCYILYPAPLFILFPPHCSLSLSCNSLTPPSVSPSPLPAREVLPLPVEVPSLRAPLSGFHQIGGPLPQASTWTQSVSTKSAQSSSVPDLTDASSLSATYPLHPATERKRSERRNTRHSTRPHRYCFSC